MGTPAPSARRTWLIIWAAICFSIVQYGLVCFLVERGRAPLPTRSADTFRPIAYALAVMSLVASIILLNVRTRAVRQYRVPGNFEKPPLPDPGDFQTSSIVAMALADAAAIYGLVLFFMGAPLKEFANFAAGTLAVLIGVVLPNGLAYWAAWEDEQKLKSEGPFSGI